MIYISHRGNINGRIEEAENKPEYIDDTIRLGYDVEIDMWVLDNGMFSLGHDQPQYDVSYTWIHDRKDRLWIHCKNIKAVEWFNLYGIEYNYFWHEEDTITLTSKGFIWAYPGKQPINRSIAVMPEIHNDNISECLGICSDNVLKYKNENISSYNL